MEAKQVGPSNEDMMLILVEIRDLLQRLVTSAQQGGGLAPNVDYNHLRKLRNKAKELGWKVKCKKQCKKGPCRYGAKQALQCLEFFEKQVTKAKKKKEFERYIPYREEILKTFSRRDLLMIASIVGVDV